LSASRKLLLRFFVRRMFSAPLTIFLQFDFALNLFFVFAGPVIQAFAFCALEFYEIWLRHIPSPCSVKCKIQNEKCKMIIQGVFYSIRLFFLVEPFYADYFYAEVYDKRYHKKVNENTYKVAPEDF